MSSTIFLQRKNLIVGPHSTLLACCYPLYGGGIYTVVVDSLLTANPLCCGGSVYGPMISFVELCVVFSFAIISLGESELLSCQPRVAVT